ncbi:MAG: hypothetical protein ACRDJ9_18280, partial [Dehalococcoidia bacterium]
MDDDGGGGGLDFGAFKAMINADNPAMLDKYAVEHYKLARELHDVAHDLDRSLGQLDDLFSSQHAAPALKARLLQSITEMDNIGARIDYNRRLLEQATIALRKAREDVNKINEDSPDASPRAEAIRDELGFRYVSITPQLDTFSESEAEPGGPPNHASKEVSAHVTSGPGSERAGGAGTILPANGPRGSSPTGRANSGPILGGPTRPGGKLGSGGDAGGAKADGRSRAGTGAGNANGTGSRTRVGIPGARSGAPIGGYRPVAGGANTGGGTTPPNGSGPGKPGTPGVPGRPGMAPPGTTGPGQPG